MNSLRQWWKAALCVGLGGCFWAGGAEKLPTSSDDPARLGGEGATQESVLRDTGEAYTTVLRELREGVTVGPKIGGSQTSLHLPVNFSKTLTVPLARWGMRPEEAELRLGRFYLDLRSISASVLTSDNADQKEVNPKSGTIGILDTEFTALLQFNDALQLGGAMSLYYLPFSGDVGFGNPLGLVHFGTFSPVADVRFSYTNLLKGWEVSVFDVFAVDYKDYDLVDGFVVFDRNLMANRDGIGRFYYGDTANNSSRADYSINQYSYRNRVGATTSKVVPTETRVTFGAAHENYWTFSGGGKSLVRDLNEAFISFQSERENMRLRPHLNYRIYQRDTDTSWNHTVSGGVTSQLTDQIDFLGDIGFDSRSSTKNGGGGQGKLIWNFALGHQINQAIYHNVYYNRRTTEPLARLEETLGYYYQQTLGPYLSAELVAERRITEDLDNIAPNNRNEFRYGGRLNFAPSPRTTMRAGAVYSTLDRSGIATESEDKLTIRMDTHYRITDITELRFLYQYEERISTRVGMTYSENLVLFGVKRGF